MKQLTLGILTLTEKILTVTAVMFFPERNKWTPKRPTDTMYSVSRFWPFPTIPADYFNISEDYRFEFVQGEKSLYFTLVKLVTEH